MKPFDFELPPELIAQQPAAERDASRLLVVQRRSQRLADHIFADLPQVLEAGDLLVLNDTRVLPARLLGTREKTGGKWEGLFLGVTADGLWEMLAQTKGKPTSSEIFRVEPGAFRLALRGRADGHWLMKPLAPEPWLTLLATHGQIPLPPYIRKGQAVDEDRQRYQTVYARADGSVAAPTAGLHFTPALLEKLEERGIERCTITLHVGLGTFEPIRTDDVTRHIMHHEHFEVSSSAVAAINDCRRRGKRVIGVGTTAARALETAARQGTLQATAGTTNLFIYPPYEFRVIDGLITNFHLPNTTLLLLVGALAGMERLQQAYQHAIENRYRFYSYGDAMLVL